MEIKTYGERVRAARVALKMSQIALAKKAGVSQTTVSDIERGRNENSKDIVQIAKALKRTPEYLLTGKERESGDTEVMTLWAALTQAEQEEIRNRVRRNLNKTEAELLAEEFIWLFNNVPEMGRGVLRGALETVRRTCIKGERRKNKD